MEKTPEPKIYFEVPSVVADALAQSPAWQSVIDTQTWQRAHGSLLDTIRTVFLPEHVQELRTRVSEEISSRIERSLREQKNHDGADIHVAPPSRDRIRAEEKMRKDFLMAMEQVQKGNWRVGLGHFSLQHQRSKAEEQEILLSWFYPLAHLYLSRLGEKPPEFFYALLALQEQSWIDFSQFAYLGQRVMADPALHKEFAEQLERAAAERPSFFRDCMLALQDMGCAQLIEEIKPALQKGALEKLILYVRTGMFSSGYKIAYNDYDKSGLFSVGALRWHPDLVHAAEQYLVRTYAHQPFDFETYGIKASALADTIADRSHFDMIPEIRTVLNASKNRQP